MKIQSTRHTFGTADVFMEAAGDAITAPSQASGVPTTIAPDTYYIDDEHMAGQWWLTIIAKGQPVKKDGTLAARVTRVAAERSQVPLEVREALATLRPDLADWLLA
jgi:hypothetical protein